MADKKIIAVVGATGAQGGGLARAILNDPDTEFTVRALTRDVTKDDARALATQGAEVVQADLDDPESIQRAFTGAYGAFCLTNFWEHFSAEREVTQARTLAEAAHAAGLSHTVWSTFEDTRRWVPLHDHRMPTLQDRYKVPHYDGKGEANAYFASLPATILLTSFYWENFVYLGAGPKPGPDGELVLTMPLGEAKLPGIASEDIGRCVHGIFQRRLVDRTIGVTGENLTGEQMAAALGRAVGQPVRYEAVDPDVFRGFDFPGADEMGNMYQVIRDFNEEYCRVRDPEFSRTLNPSLQTFDTWLQTNASRIPLH